MLRVAIADDEPLARERIRTLLADSGDIAVVGEAANGLEAVRLIESCQPDILFLDVQMPGLTGFEVIDAVGASRMPITIFVTAYDEFALKAFEACALDYLLKPFDEERFFGSLRRACLYLRGGRSRRLEESVLEELLANLSADSDQPDRLIVRTGNRLRFVDVEDVDWIDADGNYVRLYTGKESHLIRGSLSKMEARLDSRRFVRIHRSTIVNIARIKELESVFQGEYLVILHDGTKLTSSKSYRPQLEQALGIAE